MFKIKKKFMARTDYPKRTQKRLRAENLKNFSALSLLFC